MGLSKQDGQNLRQWIPEPLGGTWGDLEDLEGLAGGPGGPDNYEEDVDRALKAVPVNWIEFDF